MNIKLGADHLIIQALREDIPFEDLSTEATVGADSVGEVELISKQDGILAGIGVFQRVFELIDSDICCKVFFEDGHQVRKGEIVALVSGRARALLSGERTALNFLQRMSGIATYTRSMADLLAESGIKLFDTRKTIPNMRVFEKYAVRVGGGWNHRFGLSDGVMLKDNHIKAAGSIRDAVRLSREYAPFIRMIEVEVENMEMIKEAIEAGADIIMLDNMTPEQMKEAVLMIDGRARTECSGNVSMENVSTLRDIGIDYISSGAITHSAPFLDFSLKNLRIL